jgi:signal peptidase II
MQQNLTNFKSPAALTWLGIPFVVGLALDLWTKYLAHQNLQPLAEGAPARVHEFIPGWLHFTYVENPGAVFGLGDGYRWVFVLVSIVAVGAVMAMFAGSERRRLYQLLLGMLLAGIIGNLHDRVMVGHVRDMIHAVPRWPRFFPWVFNIADSLLCVSIPGLIIYGLIFPEKRSDAAGKPSASQS